MALSNPATAATLDYPKRALFALGCILAGAFPRGNVKPKLGDSDVQAQGGRLQVLRSQPRASCFVVFWSEFKHFSFHAQTLNVPTLQYDKTTLPGANLTRK